MKVLFGLAVFVCLIFTADNIFAQQEFTFTTTKNNVLASKATIEAPGISGNINAIITATPLGDTKKLNPHPIGVWFYQDKWNIFNTDHAAMPTGLTFKIQYFTRPTENGFLHLVSKSNLQGESSYLDIRAINNNPNAQITIFQNHAPDYREASLNKYEAIAEYDPSARKWYIKNLNGERLYANAAYNVVVGIGEKSVSSNPQPSTAGPPQSTSMSGIQTYFKNGYLSNTISVGSLLIDGMTHDIVLTKNSRVIISGMLSSPVQLEIWLKVNGTRVYVSKSAMVISNFMIDLPPGNHKIEFWRFSYTAVNNNDLSGKSSSIIVIPLE